MCIRDRTDTHDQIPVCIECVQPFYDGNQSDDRTDRDRIEIEIRRRSYAITIFWKMCIRDRYDGGCNSDRA